ncbi:MAG: bifunctional serine/threonine-protein kinase/formylglycine-generating enzyme family protein, partial [Chloroflexota bacterium]
LADMLRRFDIEARSMANLTHANIVPVMAYGKHNYAPYMVMPLYNGGDLKRVMGKPMDYKDAARLLSPIARALEYAHKKNIVHRDIKPANILLTDSGSPVLADFGIAKIINEDTLDLTRQTGTDGWIGTPEYMPPEQWPNKVVPQTDVYALGIVFYQMLTGHLPFTRKKPDDWIEVMNQHITAPLPDPRKFVPSLPQKVDTVLRKALQKDPQNRYTMEKFANELEKLTLVESPPPPPTLSIPRQKIMIGIGALLGLVLLVWFMTLNAAKPSLPPAEKQNGGVGFVVTATSTMIVITDVPTMSNTPTFTQTTVASETPLATDTPEMTATPQAGATRISEKDGMEQVYVPAGEFMMGSTQSEADAALKDCGSDCKKEWFDAEVPQHKVYLDAYWMDKNEVTNAMFAKYVETTGYKTAAEKEGSGWVYDDQNGKWSDTKGANWQHPGGSASNIDRKTDHPVVQVSWNDAKEYCNWAGKRLPTEAEWEKAARGEDGRKYPWGNGSPDKSMANYNNNIKDTVAVGSYPSGASPYGLLDMAGNILEWVYDWYDENYYQNSPDRNPEGAISGQYRGMRGGSWDNESGGLRTAGRGRSDPDDGDGDFGFRCVGF